MLRNFDTELDRHGVAMTANLHPTTSPSPVVSVTVPLAPDRSHVIQNEGDWDWRALRDYVAAQIEERFGPTPRMEGAREKAIFVGFLDRWGDQAVPIARAAFEVHGGYWKQAPVSFYRFCKNSDAYFASVIATALA